MLLRAALSVRDPQLIRRLARLLQPRSVWAEPVEIERLEPATAAHAYDLVFTGPAVSPADIQRVLEAARADEEPPAVVRLYERADPVAQALLLGEGLADSVWVGLDDDAFDRALGTVVDRRRAELEARLGKESDEPKLRDFRSLSGSMRRFLDTVETVARTATTVLVLGETGVGKEWLARAIHEESPRAAGPFVPVNCGAFAASLLESELFGHERGAFTGADRPRRGHFELAHGGTLFLDEIGDMPPALQSRLLRVLQDRRVQRLGAERAVAVDVRVIAATHRDLEREVAEGRFRADLYYRLRVVQLTLPPLRDRAEDIPSLARYHAHAAAGRIGVVPTDILPAALAALAGYRWPGNVRELANVIERLVILGRGAPIAFDDLPEEIRGAIAPPRPEPESGPLLPWKEARLHALERAERAYLERLMTHCRGRIGEAARLAGLSERGLFGKLRHHRLSKAHYR